MNQVVVANIQSRLPMPHGLELEAGKWRVLCESVFPSAKTPEAIVMALDYCKARKLDPFKRPVNIVPMWNAKLGRNVETVWPGINEVQVTATRTGQYAGLDQPSWGPEITRKFSGVRKWKNDNGKWQEENVQADVTFPEYCAVTVYRLINGQRCAFTEPVYWLEAYARIGKTEVPNDMWQKRPRGQLLKVAKAFSLRAAFPEEGEYTAEEMEGKEIDAGGIVIDNEPEITVVKSPFKNASLRKTFCENVIKALAEQTTREQVKELVGLYQAKFDEMRASGNEHDLLAVEDLSQRFSMKLKSFKGDIAEGPKSEAELGDLDDRLTDEEINRLKGYPPESQQSAQDEEEFGEIPDWMRKAQV
jgi:phage recombination protein Bet